MAVCLTTFMTIYLRRENSRREALARERGMTMGGLSDEDEREKGDDAKLFRYTV